MFSVMSTLTFLFFSPLKFLACKRNGESVFMLNVDFKETFLFVRVINGYLHACLCSCNTKVIVQLNLVVISIYFISATLHSSCNTQIKAFKDCFMFEKK